MKKLLKSILIATASVGALAGSTAAVVSCGSTPPDKPAPTAKPTADDYLAAMAAIETHFTTNFIFTASVSQLPQTVVTTGMIQQSILDYINGVANGSDKLTATQKAAFKSSLELSDITVAYTGTLETGVGSHSTTTTIGFTIVVKASSADIQGAAKPFIGADYSVMTDYDGAMAEIVYHFSSPTIPILDLTAAKIQTPADVMQAVSESLAGYINDTTSEGHLLTWQRAAFKTAAIDPESDIAVTIVGSSGLDHSIGTHVTTLNTYLTASIKLPSGTAGPAFPLIGVNYKVKAA